MPCRAGQILKILVDFFATRIRIKTLVVSMNIITNKKNFEPE